jgi:hypothetical protein
MDNVAKDGRGIAKALNSEGLSDQADRTLIRSAFFFAEQSFVEDSFSA